MFPSAQLNFYLPCDPLAVGQVRAALRRLAPAWGFHAMLDTVELVASELVTNVIAHSGDHAWFSLALDAGVVRLTTVDGSSRKPEQRVTSAEDESGRGLFLVQALCFRFGIEHLEHGKRIWADIGQPPTAEAGRLVP